MAAQQGVSIDIPTLVRVKPDVLERIGEYLNRFSKTRIGLFVSKGLPAQHVEKVIEGLRKPTNRNPLASINGNLSLDRTQQSQPTEIEIATQLEIDDDSFEGAVEIFTTLPAGLSAIVGLGGGKALDVAKYISHLGQLPLFAVPTSLSNDGFCSPQSSLTVKGRKRSLPSQMPFGVIIDTRVCLGAPKSLFLSGVGDLAAKVTAVFDWKLAFHKDGTVVNDFAALLSDATVFQFIANPTYDLEGIRLLGTSLMLNGIAMQICGSSRPASGSEHLLSHALDNLAETRNERPKPHGLQVGVATYIISRLQNQGNERIGKLFNDTGFWNAIRERPFSKADWIEAAKEAPGVKSNFYTVLSSRDCVPDVVQIIDTDPLLKGCFA